jgi:hypothetical protein
VLDSVFRPLHYKVVRSQRHALAAFYPRERPDTHCIEGWVGPEGRTGQVRKISPPTGIRSLDRPARSSVAVPTELPGPQGRFYRHQNIRKFYLFFYSTADNCSQGRFAGITILGIFRLFD